jgi:hypothetical protein
MNKFFFFFLPVFLFGFFIRFPYEISLKKDQTVKFKVYYLKYTYPFEMRWTLYKNGYIVVLYKFNNFPRQVMLTKNYPLDSFKVEIAKFPLFYPYLFIKFVDFNDKIATFKIFLYNGKSVRVEEIK